MHPDEVKAFADFLKGANIGRPQRRNLVASIRGVFDKESLPENVMKDPVNVLTTTQATSHLLMIFKCAVKGPSSTFMKVIEKLRQLRRTSNTTATTAKENVSLKAWGPGSCEKLSTLVEELLRQQVTHVRAEAAEAAEAMREQVSELQQQLQVVKDENSRKLAAKDAEQTKAADEFLTLLARLVQTKQAAQEAREEVDAQLVEDLLRQHFTQKGAMAEQVSELQQQLQLANGKLALKDAALEKAADELLKAEQAIQEARKEADAFRDFFREQAAHELERGAQVLELAEKLAVLGRVPALEERSPVEAANPVRMKSEGQE